MDAWRAQCFSLLRGAALVQDGQHRAYLRDRAAALRRHIVADDALHLRRLEREQVMRLVLTWLFPGFDDAASVLGSIDPSAAGGLDAATWQHVMEPTSFPARTARQAGTAPAIPEVSANLYPHPSPQPSQPHASPALSRRTATARGYVLHARIRQQPGPEIGSRLVTRPGQRQARVAADMRCWQVAASFRLGAPELDDLRAVACQW